MMHRHLLLGWWGLVVFLTLGILLEALHGFKVGWYLDVGQEMRRLMLTLAHAHGTLLSLVNLAFAGTLWLLGPKRPLRAGHGASPCLLSATLLMPAGFLLGGLVTYGGDPGLGILLVPVGGLLLLVAVLIMAIHVTKRPQ
jgi:hypothetical protein